MGRLRATFKGTAIEKPREKAKLNGLNSLNDGELLALFLDTGSHKENVVQLANRMLFEKGGLKAIFTQNIDLRTYGVKEGKMFRILACKEVMRRLPYLLYEKIENPLDAYLRTRNTFSTNAHESAVVIYLDGKKNVIFQELYTVESESFVIVPIEKIVRSALRCEGRFVVLVHNHPSGVLYPSKEDIELVEQLHLSLLVANVVLLDSLIVNEENYLSMRSERMGSFGSLEETN